MRKKNNKTKLSITKNVGYENRNSKINGKNQPHHLSPSAHGQFVGVGLSHSHPLMTLSHTHRYPIFLFFTTHPTNSGGPRNLSKPGRGVV